MLRFVIHVLIALLFGYLYRDVGTSANTLLANYIFVYGSNLFLHYTGQMAVTLACEFIVFLVVLIIVLVYPTVPANPNYGNPKFWFIETSC